MKTHYSSAYIFLLSLLLAFSVSFGIQQIRNENVSAKRRSIEQKVTANSAAVYVEKRFGIPAEKAKVFTAKAIEVAERHSIPPEIFLGLIATESSFNEKAKSEMGAIGLTQVMPKFHKEIVNQAGGRSQLWRAEKNIVVGAIILQKYIKRSSGNIEYALMRYHGSIAIKNSPYPSKVLSFADEFKKSGEVIHE